MNNEQTLPDGTTAYDIVMNILIQSHDKKLNWERQLPDALKFMGTLGEYKILYQHFLDAPCVLSIWKGKLILEINVNTQSANVLLDSIVSQYGAKKNTSSYFIFKGDTKEDVDNYLNYIQEN